MQKRWPTAASNVTDTGIGDDSNSSGSTSSHEAVCISPNTQDVNVNVGMIKSTYHLSGKPNERLILIHLCERVGAQFKYDAENDWCVVTALDPKHLQQVRSEFDSVIQYGIRNLVWLQADPRYTGVSVKTLHSEFMRGFANGIIGEGNYVRSKTAIERKGLRAGLAYGK
jgi:hypothetical protein